MGSLGIKALTLNFMGLCVALLAAGANPSLCEGDLLFTYSDSTNAITAVTQGVDNYPIDHVGIAHYIGGEQYGLLYVIEAISPNVCLTPIDSFVVHHSSQHATRIIVGRATDCDSQASTQRALRYVGAPYDHYFMPSDSAIYCSELVLKSYVDRHGNTLFSPIPMTFRDPSGHITPFWQQHYAKRGLPVPQGEPGSNPGELSRRPQVTIIGPYE